MGWVGFRVLGVAVNIYKYAKSLSKNKSWFIHPILMTAIMIMWTIMLCTHNAQASVQEIYIATENRLLINSFGLLLSIIAFGWIVWNIWSYLKGCLRIRKISLKIIAGLLGLTFIAIFAIYSTLTAPIETQINYNESGNTIILYEHFYLKSDKMQIIPLDPDVSSIKMELGQTCGAYGLIGEITITRADGQKIIIYTDDSWTSTKHVGRKLHEVTGMPLYIQKCL